VRHPETLTFIFRPIASPYHIVGSRNLCFLTSLILGYSSLLILIHADEGRPDLSKHTAPLADPASFVSFHSALQPQLRERYFRVRHDLKTDPCIGHASVTKDGPLLSGSSVGSNVASMDSIGERVLNSLDFRDVSGAASGFGFRIVVTQPLGSTSGGSKSTWSW
jgi:hypothetical protein